MSLTPASSLSPAQQKVAELLASGVPLSHAAAQAGVSRQTIYNWQTSLPAFAESVAQAQADYNESLKDQLQHLSVLALQALQQILEDPKASPGIKLRAALAILKRPNSPNKPGWNLPAATLTKLDTNSVSTAPIPRGALCPCKSGEKYKRCCGKNAPPVLHHNAA